MITEPKLEVRDELHFAAVRAQVPIPFGEYLPGMWGEVAAWLAGRGVKPAGAPIIRYLTTDMNTKLDIEVGFPVAAALPGDERITTGVLPAGRYAVMTHLGPYDHLVEATGALLEWAKQNDITWRVSVKDGIEWWGARFESYPTDPQEEPDPQKWQTDILFLTAGNE